MKGNTLTNLANNSPKVKRNKSAIYYKNSRMSLPPNSKTSKARKSNTNMKLILATTNLLEEPPTASLQTTRNGSKMKSKICSKMASFENQKVPGPLQLS